MKDIDNCQCHFKLLEFYWHLHIHGFTENISIYFENQVKVIFWVKNVDWSPWLFLIRDSDNSRSWAIITLPWSLTVRSCTVSLLTTQANLKLYKSDPVTLYHRNSPVVHMSMYIYIYKYFINRVCFLYVCTPFP